MKISAIGSLILAVFATLGAHASDYVAPKPTSDRVVVIDAYEKNPIDWPELQKNKNLRAFIGKASDGLAPPWACPQRDDEARSLCKKTFQNYHLKKELYHTRKTMAKAMGLKWGAYHLGRPGNPIEQAYHFLQFADPQPDELIALDIEHDDPEKWISFADAERFARYIHARIGRYPVLYTNHDTAKRIAAQRDQYPLLSRLPLWYARFKSDIRGVFPMGHWESYALWQFSARPNCNKRRCLYRIKGTQPDIDVNATGLTDAEFEAAWPFDGLVPARPDETDEPVLVATAEPEGERAPEAEPNAPTKPVIEVKPVIEQASAAAISGGDAETADPEQPERKRIERYRVRLSFTNDEGETVRLATVAVPSPRDPGARERAPTDVDNAEKTAVAQIASIPAEEQETKTGTTTTFASVTDVTPSDFLPSQELPADEQKSENIASVSTPANEEVSLLLESDLLANQVNSSRYGYVHATHKNARPHGKFGQYLN